MNGDESLAVTSRSFQWDRVGGSGSVSQSSVLTFNTLSRDDDGEYMCTSTFTSPYLTNTQTVTATTMVTINRELKNCRFEVLCPHYVCMQVSGLDQ